MPYIFGEPKPDGTEIVPYVSEAVKAECVAMMEAFMARWETYTYPNKKSVKPPPVPLSPYKRALHPFRLSGVSKGIVQLCESL